ncbi:MAG TPA: hypothetical protein PLP07_02660 [Pyrinomonadaceae bacterium]|nr:hypothetical protein [Chloracidobacterium sp.]MBP9934124.1 hypothetical protein [Pyrinomonadaceae bacterium]MBK7801676.1 hypothetical protein [Chloracidobacterium sp.]MBK9436994.1 hypothetical protein [Chloracidobacterium sp.]MBL0241987.1 hypothetical protein [Chloracidobacterium sp.]
MRPPNRSIDTDRQQVQNDAIGASQNRTTGDRPKYIALSLDRIEGDGQGQEKFDERSMYRGRDANLCIETVILIAHTIESYECK